MKKINSTILIFALALFVVGCAESSEEQNQEIEQIEGIDVKVDITSNIEAIDEGILEASITNTTDKTFTGKVSITHSSFKHWSADINDLAPGTTVVRSIKTKFIENPKDPYTPIAKGVLEEKEFTSDVEYEIVSSENDKSFKIKTDKIDKEIAFAIVSELYSKYGSGIVYIGLFDASQESDDLLPRAQYFGNLVEKSISLNLEDGTSEKFEFEAP